MLPNLLQLISRRPSRDYERGFVREVVVRERSPRNRRIETLIRICWGLIAIKSVFVFWAVDHYRIPFNGWWVVGPTIVFAALCTVVYYWRH